MTIKKKAKRTSKPKQTRAEKFKKVIEREAKKHGVSDYLIGFSSDDGFHRGTNNHTYLFQFGAVTMLTKSLDSALKDDLDKQT